MKSYYDEYYAKNTGKAYRVYNFDTIENATDAYFVGIVATDGAYIMSKHRRQPRMSFSSNDRELITTIGDHYCRGVNVVDRSNRLITFGEKQYKTENYELNFPVGTSRSLENFGVNYPKGDRILKKIPKEFLSAYMLGIIDGDGCIAVVRPKNSKSVLLNVRIVTGAITLAPQLRKVIEDEFGFTPGMRFRAENCIELYITATKRAIDFCKWIYSNPPLFCSKRKKKIFDDFYEEYKNKLGVSSESTVQ